MGQTLSSFRNSAHRYRRLSEQQETESICMEVMTDLTLTDRQVEDLSQIIMAKHMATIVIRMSTVSKVIDPIVINVFHRRLFARIIHTICIG